MSPSPVSELFPASVRSVVIRPEASRDLIEGFHDDVRALIFRRLRVGGTVYAAIHLLALAVLVAFGVGPIKDAAIQRSVAVAFALVFAAVTYLPNLERWAFPLSVALTIGNAAYTVLPMLRYGVAGGSDVGMLVLFVVFTGWAFPYTLKQILAVLGIVLAMYLAAGLARVSRADAGWLVEGLFLVTTAAVITSVGTHLADQLRRREHRARWELSQEREAAEQLLLNILPASIVERLKRDQAAIAEGFLEATVLFVDLVGFTPLSAKMAPTKLVAMLNEIFSKLDALTEKYGLEKIKTIGDAYMAVAGVPTPRKDHAVAVANMALEAPRRGVAFPDSHRRAHPRPDRHQQRPGRRRRHRHQEILLRSVGRHREHRRAHGSPRRARHHPGHRTHLRTPAHAVPLRAPRHHRGEGQGRDEDVCVDRTAGEPEAAGEGVSSGRSGRLVHRSGPRRAPGVTTAMFGSAPALIAAVVAAACAGGAAPLREEQIDDEWVCHFSWSKSQSEGYLQPGRMRTMRYGW